LCVAHRRIEYLAGFTHKIQLFSGENANILSQSYICFALTRTIYDDSVVLLFMKANEIYRSVRKPLLDRGVVVTRVEPSKKGRGSFKRKTKYGKSIEYDEC